MGLFGLPGGNKNGKKAARARARQSNGGSVFRYTHMPEIFPRIRAIGQKLGHFSFMLALVFRSARLLPANHPMLNPVNIGRFGVTDVIATAANGLVLKRENMDQIIVFGAVVMAMLMIAVQAVMIFAYAFLGSAQASSGSMFATPNPQTDLVSQFLGQVFGFQSIFGSPASVEQPGFYAILGFYSTAMMIFAVLIVVYYVITVVGESAQTGQPFGKRFNGLWAPIRLVLALGLLVPLGGGINAAQYLTLYIAKFGSGLATQGWIKFTDNFMRADRVVGQLSAPSAQGLAASIFAAEACRGAYNQAYAGTSNPVNIRVNAGRRSQIATFQQADINFARSMGATSITYVWTTQGPLSSAAAESTCGAIAMRIASSVSGVNGNTIMNLGDTISSNMQNSYVQAMGAMITTLSGSTTAVMQGSTTWEYVNQTMTINQTGNFLTNSDPAVKARVLTNIANAMDTMQRNMNDALVRVNDDITNRQPAGNVIDQQMKTDATRRGWGTAGVYYLEIAKFTQMVMDAVGNAEPKAIKGQEPQGTVNGISNWWTTITTGNDVNRQMRTVLENVGPTVQEAAGQAQVSASTNNPAESVMGRVDDAGLFSDPLLWMARYLFGSSFFKLFDQPTLNPMGMLISGGKEIMDRVSSMFTLWLISQTGAIGGALVGGALGAAGTAMTGPGVIPGVLVGLGAGALFISKILAAAGPVILFLMLIGAGVGVVLFYLLPLLPFMYFFFSVVNWVIEVAEAFVSMPLFALSHLRIDGDGLFPQNALNNWITMFGILLRPLLIVIGMIVGSLVFNAGAYYLASIFKYAIFSYNEQAQGATGLDLTKIGAFGLVTYVILYVYMIYMLATSSFKLVDQIPDKMLRWIGGPTPFTGDRPVDLQGMQGAALMGYGVLAKTSDTATNLGKSLQDAAGRMGGKAGGAVGGGGGANVGGK